MFLYMLKYYNQNGIFSARNLYKKDEDYPSVIIITWQSQFLSELTKRFTVSDYSKKLCAGGTSVITKIFELNEFKIGFALLPAGGPIASMMMEEMNALGAEQFVFIGSCGNLLDEKSDSLIVPTRALRDEGTSYHYLPADNEFIEIETSQFTDAFLDSVKVPHRMGATWTTDAFYRETPGALKEAREKHCICVEMECASIMAVAKAKNIPTYQILFTADKLESDNWNIGRLKSMGFSTYGTYLEIVLELVERLSGPNPNGSSSERV